MMLARQLPGASVLVSADRYTAGRLAEHHLGSTVHVLDDGFQHVQLDRDVDLVLLGFEDLKSPVTLPGGSLREPVDCIVAADAVLMLSGENKSGPWEAPYFASSLDLPVFTVTRVPPPRAETTPAFAIAGIAEPQRFFDSARHDGWQIVGSRAFRDHYPYRSTDIASIVAAARAAGAHLIVTTEKDYVRLLPFRPFEMPVTCVPYVLEPERRDEFRTWLQASLDDARDVHRE
jgi:tetraacyldisaccharide 4'-kinase